MARPITAPAPIFHAIPGMLQASKSPPMANCVNAATRTNAIGSFRPLSSSMVSRTRPPMRSLPRTCSTLAASVEPSTAPRISDTCHGTPGATSQKIIAVVSVTMATPTVASVIDGIQIPRVRRMLVLRPP